MIKKLIAVLLCLPLLAVAEPIAQADNDGGGKIVLTNDACIVKGKHYENLYVIYSVLSGGRSIDGCYGLEGDTVVAIWEDCTKYRYPVSIFTLIKKKSGKQI
jgi:hypothetical protein